MNKKGIIILPHGHLSWSGLNTWEKDPEDYWEKYVLNLPQFINSGMRFGRYLSEELEKKTSKDASITKLRKILPAYDIPEKKLDVIWNQIPLTGRLDTFRMIDNAFREYKSGRRYKTGDAPWNLRLAKAHGQIAFYAFLIWIIKGKLPPTAFLDWIETIEDAEGVVSLTGHVESFEVPITLPMVLDIGGRIQKAATQINKDYVKILSICQK